MNTKKVLYTVIGCLGLGLSILGVMLPVIPSFPFVLLTAFCFAKSSGRLHNWFINTKLYKFNLESYVKGEGMTVKTKCCILGAVTALMGMSFVMMRNVPAGMIAVAVVWLAQVFYFGLWVKTKRQDRLK